MRLKDRLSKLEQVTDGDDGGNDRKCARLIADRCAELLGDRPVPRSDKAEGLHLICAVLADIQAVKEKRVSA